MAKAKTIKPLPEREGKKFRLRIDMRTIITVRGEDTLKEWLDKYPKAQIIEG
jgi:hypothetical protein